MNSNQRESTIGGALDTVHNSKGVHTGWINDRRGCISRTVGSSYGSPMIHIIGTHCPSACNPVQHLRCLGLESGLVDGLVDEKSEVATLDSGRLCRRNPLSRAATPYSGDDGRGRHPSQWTSYPRCMTRTICILAGLYTLTIKSSVRIFSLG